MRLFLQQLQHDWKNNLLPFGIFFSRFKATRNSPQKRARSLFGRGLQFLARVLQVVSRQFEVRSITECLLASSRCFFVATELIVSGANVVPCFSVAWSKVESVPASGN